MIADKYLKIKTTNFNDKCIIDKNNSVLLIENSFNLIIHYINMSNEFIATVEKYATLKMQKQNITWTKRMDELKKKL